MPIPFSRALLGAASLLALCVAGAATAQTAPTQTPPAQPAADSDSQVVVVVGTPGGKGINKLKASYAVTNITATDMLQAGPKSSAELLTLVPGIWVESSGGVSGANIFVRGFPAGGDAEFVTFQINGSPIYPPSTLAFLENSSMFRVDETISRVEALRGGPNPIFSNGQPGLTVNNILKEGGDTTEGDVKASFTDYGTRRVDALLSGKLADDLYYMVGGYATSSPGIRDTQFDSEVGQQLTVNITKKFDGGKLSVWSRATDDHGAWYLPFAVNVPGIDKGTYTELGNYSRFADLQVNSHGDHRLFDLSDGRGWKGTVSGISFEKALDNGWSVRDHFSYTKGDANTYGLVGDGSAVKASAIASTVKTADGRTLGAHDYVQNWGQWVVLKDISALTNDLSVSKSLGDHDLTFGFYTADVKSDDWWSIGHARPMEVKANGNYLDPSISCAATQAATGASCFVFGLADAGTLHTNAFYVADSWTVTDKLRIDLGARSEQAKTNFVLDTGNGYPDGVIDMVVNDTRSRTSYTVGANYSLSSTMGIFGRASTGFKFPTFDDFRNGQPDTQSVKQYELGYKLGTRHFDLYATAFHNRFEGAKFATVGSSTPNETNVNEATGLELDGRFRTDNGISLALNGTFQKAKIVASSDPASVGKKAQRQPEMQLRVTPRYVFSTGNFKTTVYGTVSTVGDRFVDNQNTATLPGYTKVDLGAIVDLGAFTVQVAGDNIGNSKGLTEGDPRSTTSSNARPIFGRSYKVTLGYKF